MKMRTIKHFLAACFLLVFATSIHAQEQGTKTYLPKFAIKTNALYWATSTPNLGFEVALAKKLTLDVSGNYNPWKFSKDRQIKHWLVQPELRYWLCERFNGSFFGLHGHYADVNMSNLDIFGLGNYRYDGKIYGAGISYGYHWILKNRWKPLSVQDMPAWTMTNTHVASVVKSWGTTTRIISDRPKSDSASFIPSSKRPAFTGTNYKKLNQQ